MNCANEKQIDYLVNAGATMNKKYETLDIRIGECDGINTLKLIESSNSNVAK